MTTGRFWIGAIAIWSCILFLTEQSYAAARRPHLRIELAQFQSGEKDDSIRSQIIFSPETETNTIRLADLSIPDSLGACPVDTMPPDLAAMVSELANKVSAVVAKIKDDQGDRCAALNNRLQATQNQVGAAFQFQLIASSAIAANANQDIINQQTQRASAINQLVLTTSDILQNCISRDAISDQQVIQKLIAQIVTLTGLFMGGWQGIALATGGQVIGALPLFTGDLDVAIRQFRRYNEYNERGTFLCYLRQIRKTSCLLFANEDDLIINGLDLSFKTGPVRTTIDTIEAYKQAEPVAVDELGLLWRIKTQSSAFMEGFAEVEKQIKHINSPQLSPIFKVAVDQLAKFCQSTQPLKQLSDDRLKDPIINQSLEYLTQICGDPARFVSLSLGNLYETYWKLYSINGHYQKIIGNESSAVGKIGRTLESMVYFENLKKSFFQYANANAGNQTRIHFLDFARNLSRTLGASTFKKLFNEDYSKYTRNKLMFSKMKRFEFSSQTIENGDVRGRALRAMIDLCMTFDPTLACLDVGNPRKDRLFKTWVNYCMGPSSYLCSSVTQRGERSLFLKDSKYRSYFNSVCGSESDSKEPLSASGLSRADVMN